MLLWRAESHDRLHACPVVPGPVEDHHFATGRQMRHIALEVPGCTVPVRRFRQRHRPHGARAHIFHDAFDRAVFTGRIRAFEDHRDLLALIESCGPAA